MRGSLVPLITPLREGRIDDSALTDLVEWHIESGSDGVVMCGSTGDLHFHMLPMNDALFLDTNPIPAKTVLGWMGKCLPEVRLPHAPMRPEADRVLREVAATYGLVPAVPGERSASAAGV